MGLTMNQFDAVMIAEGVQDATGNEAIEAWQYLIDTGLCWQLQGYFGRHAMALIRDGIVNPPSGYVLNNNGKLEKE